MTMLALFFASLLVKLKALGARVWPWLKEHWLPFACVGLLMLCLLIGRCSAPKPPPPAAARVEYRDRVVTKTVTVAEKETDRAREADLHVVRHATTTRDKKPTGEVLTTRVVDTELGAAEHQVEVKTEVRYVDRVQVQEHEVTKTVTVDKPKDWHVSALVGAPVHLKPLGVGPPVFGAGIERRVLGPVSFGIWGLSSGEFGASLGVAF